MPSDPSSLASFIASVGSERQLRVEESLGAGFVRLRVDEAERRQAKHDIRCVEDAVIELLRNARDAGARHIFVATSREGDIRTTTMLDDGCGIPAQMHERIFDARVTSKLESFHMDRWGVHGRGMALFSIRENANEARVVSSGEGLGCSIQLVTDATKLPERADQSTWPKVGTDDEGQYAVTRGPHNIIRSCCEFALEERDVCEVYLGSPSEVVATARRRIKPSRAGSSSISSDLNGLPVLERLCLAADAAELLDVSHSLGLCMSERTTHRIISGEILPLRSVLSRLMHKPFANAASSIDLSHNHRGLRMADEDIKEFSNLMERDFAYLAERYYLSLSGAPRIRYSNGHLTVSFDIELDE